MNKKQMLAIGIYAIGIVCVVTFLLKAVIGGDYVKNPQAMIPFTALEAYIIILGIGCIPMIASCIFLIHSFNIKNIFQRVIIFIPGVITAIPFVIVVGIIMAMLVKAFFEAIFGILS